MWDMVTATRITITITVAIKKDSFLRMSVCVKSEGECVRAPI